MNAPRIAITQDERGEIVGICADQPVEVYFVCPHRPHDRVYLFDSVDVGPQHIREAIGGYAIGHAEDGVLGGEGAHLPPIKPGLRVVE